MEDGRHVVPRMLRAPEVEALTGLSNVTIWRLEKTGDFPRRRRLVGNLVAWREDEVREWIEAREQLPLEEASAPGESAE